MRVIVLIKSTADSEAGIMPSAELIEAMGGYNRELVDAGIMRDGEGIRPSSEGERVAIDGEGRTVTGGPSLLSANWWPGSGCGRSRAWTRPWSG